MYPISDHVNLIWPSFSSQSQAEVLSVVGKLVTHRIMARVIQLTTMVFLLKEELLEIYGSLS